jgi:hypothetical protein
MSARAKLFSGFGGLLSFETVAGVDPFDLLNALQAGHQVQPPRRQPNAGPARGAHHLLGDGRDDAPEHGHRRFADRVSVGIEAVDDLLADFEQAFASWQEVIQLRNVTLRRGAKVLLDGVTSPSIPARRSAWWAATAPGKSTLFALLNGSLHEDAGDFSIPRSGSWRRWPAHAGDRRNRHRLRAGRRHRLMALREELARAEESGDGMAIAIAHSDHGRRRRARCRCPRAQALILGLGFRPDELTGRSTASPAAGACGCSWRAR